MSLRVVQRRQRTIDEIVTVATDVMADSGAAGLSLGEIAKRMGMSTPSLYGYFDSRAALCDEIFGRGWAALIEVIRPRLEEPPGQSPEQVHDQLTRGMRTFVGWTLEHQAQAQLMFWRPVAGWEPTEDAYAHAGEMLTLLESWIGRMQEHGALRGDCDTGEMQDVLITLVAGVITQQLANEPGVGLSSGRFAARIDALAAAYLAWYGNRSYRARTPVGDRRARGRSSGKAPA